MASFFTRGGTRGGSSFFKQKKDEYDTESVNRSIENAQLRIKDAGFKVEDADQRNWFEKAANLPQNQNFLFDTLEILGRPGQAVLNPLSKFMQGKDEEVGKSFFKGLSGQEKVRGSQVVENAGVDNKLAKTVLGTGLEIATDPLSFVPGGAIAKGTKLASKAVTVPVKGAYNLAEKASPNLKKLRGEVIQPTYQSTKDKLGYAFNDDYKVTETLSGGKSDMLLSNYTNAEAKRRYLQEEYGRKLTDTAKTTGVEAGEQVGRQMESGLRQFEDVKGFEFPDGVTRTTNKGDLTSEIGVNKASIQNIGKEIKQTNQGYQEAIGEFSKELDNTNNELRKLYFGFERNARKVLSKTDSGNLRDATRGLAKIESQLNNFGQNENSLMRHFKKEIREVHESKFDLMKSIRQTAPNGIKFINKSKIPNRLKNLSNDNGLHIEKVAQELGFDYADDMLENIRALDRLPRKLGNDGLESLARKEMERTGALKQLDLTKRELELGKATMLSSIKELKGKTDLAERSQEKAFSDISLSPKYDELDTQRKVLKEQLDALKSDSKQASQSKLDNIRKLENDIEKLKTSIKNPVMIQKEIERVIRELPKDPNVKKAADSLMQSNTEIRALAESEGIAISELEGYMTHILSREEKVRRKARNVNTIDRGNFGLGQPNKKVLNPRKLMGSVEDVNELTERKFFEPNAYFATARGQRRLIDYIQSVSFRKNVLNDRNFARPYVKGSEIPENAVVIDTNNYKFIKESGDLLEDVASKDIGGQYVVTKAAKQKLDKYKYSMTDEGSKAFLNTFDALQSFWKRAALFSIPYHLRNDVGAKFNNWVGGMSELDLIKYSKDADVDVFQAMRGKESPLYNEYRQQGLGATSQSKVEFVRRGADPDKAVERMVKEGSKSKMGKVKDRLNPLRAFETSREFGDFVDQTNRFAAYKWAREKLKLSPEDAAKKTKELQFDYTKLSKFERDYAARAIPFYRWMRNNIPFQIRQFINDPRKYANINKLRLNAIDAAGINEKNMPDWMKESFSIPVSSDGKGSGKMLGFNLPLGDLTKLSNPLKMGIDSLTPVAKLPLELGINRNLFYNKPIEKFEGQTKKFNVLGKEFNVAVKKAYALEQATGQIGRGLSGFLTKPEEADQDTKFRMPSFGISGVLKEFDANKANYFQLRNKLKELQDYISYIEQQTGERPRNVNDINKKQTSGSFFSRSGQ